MRALLFRAIIVTFDTVELGVVAGTDVEDDKGVIPYTIGKTIASTTFFNTYNAATEIPNVLLI
jgi:hypothetical protein